MESAGKLSLHKTIEISGITGNSHPVNWFIFLQITPFFCIKSKVVEKNSQK